MDDCEESEILKDVAKQVEGELRTDYIGCNMYDTGCFAIVTNDPIGCIELVASKGVFGANIAPEGWDSVVYWEHIKNK